jgi:hypothetical protein
MRLQQSASGEWPTPGGDVTVAKIGHPAVGDYADFLCAVFVVWGFLPRSCQRVSVISTP